MSVANAYSTCTLACLLCFVASVLQGVSGWGLDGSISIRARLQGPLFPVAGSNDTTTTQPVLAYYNSSRRLDWVQVSAGASGWLAVAKGTAMNASVYAVPDAAVMPLVGSIYCGVVAAFLVLCFFLSLYLSLRATPEGESTYLCFDPRGLIVVNAIVTVGTVWPLHANFVGCSGRTLGGTLFFAALCFVVCWAEETFVFIWGLFCLGKAPISPIADQVLRIVVLLLLSWLPEILLAVHPSATEHDGGGVPAFVQVVNANTLLCPV